MTPKQAEDFIYDTYNSKKLKSCIFRFQDTHDATSRLSRNGLYSQKAVLLAPNPSDFVMTKDGVTSFVEVKTTESKTGVVRGLFKEQEARRDRILDCGGSYIYFIYSNCLCKWFEVKGEVIRNNPNMKWEELEKVCM